MTQQLTVDQLRSVLSETLSPDAERRRAAENHLTQAQKVSGHPLVVLQIVASSDAADVAVRQAAAVHFKNIVKKAWSTSEDHAEISLAPADRNTIKQHLVELMCTVPPAIQMQCSDSISLIAAVDFPAQWDNLLPELVRKFSSPDPAVVNGVLLTANSIFKRFRYVQKSDALFKDILYVLEKVQAPLLTLFQTTGAAIDAYPNDPKQLEPRFRALRSMCRIFFSLNWQDLPEFFEDNMELWMKEFAKYLRYTNPVLENDADENEPTVIDSLQAAIVDNLNLYTNKDEEPFMPFLPDFTTLVWHLLMNVTSQPRHDELATTSIKFLAGLVEKLMHRNLFESEETLRNIILKIVVPNLMVREVDEERFEDDPSEFIMGDMEGGDTDSRRRCSQLLLRAMCRQFEAETTAITGEHVGGMLADFTKDPLNKWGAKDAAIHLMLGISIRAESEGKGVSIVNDKVNIMEFFSTHILPELQEPNMSTRPMLKATALKFVSTFRNQFTKEHLTSLMPLLIAHLSAPSVVVHTYAAAAIEKILITKQEGSNTLKFGGQEIKPFLEPLFSGLFSILDHTELNENEYVMKCVMRSLSVAGGDLVQVTEIVLNKLTAALERVAKNPRNPQYNHYLFESIAVLIRYVCGKDPAYTQAFESLLFPPFQTVLQMDVFEFTPYVFQLLAQLLEYRAGDTGIGEAYTMLFPPLLTPTLWERRGNVPALTRLLEAYLHKGAKEIANHLLGMLGVFQKLVSSRANEQSAFDLLNAIISTVPPEVLQPHLKSLFQILLMRLQQASSPRYTRLVTQFFALFVGKFGPKAYLDQLGALQPGLGLMLLKQVWAPRFETTDLPIRMEAKVQVIGLTKILCESPELLADANGPQLWSQVLKGTMKILSNPNVLLASGGADEIDFADVEIGYDATFSKLQFAVRSAHDPFPQVTDPSLTLVQSLHGLFSSQPGMFTPLIQQGLQSDPKLSANFESLFSKAGLHLV